MNGRGKYEWQRRQRFEIVGGQVTTGETERPFMTQKALRRHMAVQGSQPRSGQTVTVAIPDWEEFQTMNNDETIISLLTEIRDLLRGGAATAVSHPGELRFVAEKMTATVNDGKAYWKVRGGVFSKFGVTVWPEVLSAAGFDPEAMNPMTIYDLTGWTAVYILNEEGNAQKVVQLLPPVESNPEPQQTAVKPAATANGNGHKANGKAAPAEEPVEPSFFRAGDKVIATDQNGVEHEGIVTAKPGRDGKVAVKISGKIYRLDLDKVEMVEPAF